MVFNVMFYGPMAQLIKSNLIASKKNQYDQSSYLCVNKTKKLNSSINDEKIYEKDRMEDCMDHDLDEEYEEEEEETLEEALLESNTTTATNSDFQSLSSSLNSTNGEKYMNEQNCLENTTKSLLNLDERIFNDWGIEVIRVPDISPIAFNIMIDYIYMNFDSRKSVSLNEENVMHTLYAGFNFFCLYKL